MLTALLLTILYFLHKRLDFTLLTYRKLLEALKERGYVLKNAMAADLFPRCSHVESIVCLSKLADTHIEREIDSEELDTITA